MKKYRYPENIRCSDFGWIDYLCKEENINQHHIKNQVQSIIQNEIELSRDDINEYMDSIGRLISSEKDKLDMLLNIANQIADKFEEVA